MQGRLRTVRLRCQRDQMTARRHEHKNGLPTLPKWVIDIDEEGKPFRSNGLPSFLILTSLATASPGGIRPQRCQSATTTLPCRLALPVRQAHDIDSWSELIGLNDIICRPCDHIASQVIEAEAVKRAVNAQHAIAASHHRGMAVSRCQTAAAAYARRLKPLGNHLRGVARLR